VTRAAVINSRIHDWSSEGGALIERTEPWTGEPLKAVREASRKDVALACETAVHAQREWVALPLADRELALRSIADELERRDDLAPLLAREVGKPIVEAEGEVARTVAIFRFYASMLRIGTGEVLQGPVPSMRVFSRRRPLGVVGLITPWNFPLAIPAWKMAPALVAGNGVVLKPATAGAGVATVLMECVEEAPIPDGLVALVTGRGSVVADALVGDPNIRGVSFTGSVEVGRVLRVACAERGIRIQTELGGRNPAIVLADANLEAAAAAVASGAFGYAGQKCTATRRALIQDSVYGHVRSLLSGAAERMVPGDPLDRSTLVGPLISRSAADAVRASIREAVEAGAELICGGAEGDGGVVVPTIVAGVPADVDLGCDEVFGPVLVLEAVRDLDHAIASANATPFGLSAAIHTASLASAARFEAEIEAGVVVVNRPTSGVELHAPFGGMKASGYGWREQGVVALAFYSELQAIYEA